MDTLLIFSHPDLVVIWVPATADNRDQMPSVTSMVMPSESSARTHIYYAPFPALREGEIAECMRTTPGDVCAYICHLV